MTVHELYAVAKVNAIVLAALDLLNHTVPILISHLSCGGLIFFFSNSKKERGSGEEGKFHRPFHLCSHIESFI